MIRDWFTRKSQEPEAPARREPMLVRRSFKAAFPDRLAGKFNMIMPTSPRDEVRREIRGLVNHARHASQNFDFARNYEMLVRRHVIGPNGIRLQMNVQDENPARPDPAANRQIEAAWARWGQMGSPTICGRLSWWGLESQIVTAVAREGGAFLRFYEGTNRGPFGFRVEAIPFDLLDLDFTRPLSTGGYVESGIEFNAEGRILAFHIWNTHPAEYHRHVTRRRLRIPARQMIYITVPEGIGEALGVPRTSTALRLMNMSESYQESAMTAANYGAANMVFFEQEDTTGALRGSDVDTEIPIDEIEAGTMAMLPPGVKAVPNAPHYPDAAVEPFMRHMGTSQAAGLGVAYETLSGDLSRANFSSLRAGKGEERDEWRMLQRAVYEGCHDRVFRRWLPMAMLSGQVRLPMQKMDKFLAPSWRPRGWQSVNPKDDATANQTEVALGTRTLTEITAERGRNFEDVCAERAAEKKLLKSHGLTAAEVIAPAPKRPDDEGVEE